MKFRSEVLVPHSSWEISLEDNVQMYGSCFVEEIGKRLWRSRFRVDCNPFGVLYNPLSISQSILKLLRKEDLTTLIVQREGMFHSLLHHSSFSSTTRGELVNNIRSRAEKSYSFLQKTRVFIITLGSSYLYEYEGNVVANCHKLPEKTFSRRRLGVEEIVLSWSELIQRLLKLNPDSKIIFSVSPIRHWRDGIHNNQISKSILLLSVEELCERFACCNYFPAYEIMMDELRDYRFYDSDLNHIAPIAVQYIWERFCETYLSKQSLEIMKDWEEILKLMEHKPISPTAENEQKLNAIIEEKKSLLLKKLSRFNLSENMFF